MEESFDRGQATITVRGSSAEDVAVAALQVEVMLCNAVDEFVREEERLSGERLDLQRTALDPVDFDCLEAVKTLREIGHNPVKVNRNHPVRLLSSYRHQDT